MLLALLADDDDLTLVLVTACDVLHKLSAASGNVTVETTTRLISVWCFLQSAAFLKGLWNKHTHKKNDTEMECK